MMIVEVIFWNTLVTLVIGSCLNLFTIWMILNHTPTEMRPYSRMLIQSCVTDLVVLTLSFIIQPVSVIGR
jgi:hypothetical protein